MATDDQQILVTGTASAPATWLVPGNGQVTPRSIFAHYNGASATSSFFPALKVISDAGQTVGIYPCPTAVAAGGSADVSWFPHVAPPAEGVIVPGVSSESLFLDSTSAGVTSNSVLVSGTTYQVTVQGTFSIYNDPLGFGTPEANAQYPGSTVGRVSTQVGRDADTVFADINAGSYPTHQNMFQINTGSGYSHVEPDGGPFNSPQPNHFYTYTLIGQGATVSFRISDTPLNDNYGLLLITLQVPSASAGGTAVPQATTANNGQALVVLAGVPTWNPVDGGSA